MLPLAHVMDSAEFLTPEQWKHEQEQHLISTRGRLVIASCRSGSHLAARVVARYRELLREARGAGELTYLEGVDHRFGDGETGVRLGEHVGGHDVYLFQALYDPTSDRSVDENYVAFLVAARAVVEHGARHVTGVLPYLAYARQDKPTRFEREPTTARLMADLSIAAGMDRLISWHPHAGQVRGFYGSMPVNMLEALGLFVHEFRRFEGREDVIAVAPDLGASRFIAYFGRALGLSVAVASKYRPRPEVSVVTEVIGDFRRKRVAIVLDDMISGGGTIHAIIRELVERKGIEQVHVGASHGLCVGPAVERLRSLYDGYGLQEVVITDSIPQTEEFLSLPFIRIRSLADPLAWAINRIHYHRSLAEVFDRPLIAMAGADDDDTAG